ncbi:uncharacterized protein LOC117282568 [Cryptotermes secundus]|uniref:uncharacterized protein LOC117282568 n=1 Tax=Cryptotermes secundus TaxID=105785 RepID=UPI001454C484|nr:uncharacterized protein LOC117282568 [Cryptotermes secundus]
MRMARSRPKGCLSTTQALSYLCQVSYSSTQKMHCLFPNVWLSEPPPSEKSSLVSRGHRKGTSYPGEDAPPIASKKCEITEKCNPGLQFLKRNFTVSCFLVFVCLASSTIKMEALASRHDNHRNKADYMEDMRVILKVMSNNFL